LEKDPEIKFLMMTSQFSVMMKSLFSGREKTQKRDFVTMTKPVKKTWKKDPEKRLIIMVVCHRMMSLFSGSFS